MVEVGVVAARQGCRLRGSPRERMLRRLHFFGLPSACLDAAEDDRAEAPAAADGGGGASFLPPAPWWSLGASSSRAPPTLRGGALVACACRRSGLESWPRAEAASRKAKGGPDPEA